MSRTGFALILVLFSTPAFAQDGILSRTGRALDNAGKNIRGRVENEVARGQISAQERELFNRVAYRVDFDKQLAGSTMQMQVRPNGVVVLKGSVLTDSAKLRAVDLVENTVGVTSVVDELAVVREVKVISAAPKPIVEVSDTIIVPADPKPIIKP